MVSLPVSVSVDRKRRTGVASLPTGWEQALLRWLALVTCPAAAGAAFTVLALGVVTWLPALASMAYVLRQWRVDGDDRCFTGVFAAWRRYWRALLPHSVLSTAGAAVLVGNLAFLSGRSGPNGPTGLLAFGLLCCQLGLAAGYVVYHLSLAATAGCTPAGTPTTWRHDAVALAFGSPWRTLLLLSAVAFAPLATLVVPLGPALLGTSLPVLLAVHLRESTS